MPAGLLAPGQARVHPLRLAAALARRAGSVATGVAMTDLEVDGGRIVRVRTTAGDLHPGMVVFATGLAPEPWVQVPQRLVKGHLVATEPVEFRLRCGVHSPGFGVGSMVDGGLLAGGTRDEGDHSAQVRPQVIQGIRRRLGALLPAAAQVRVRYQWCCFRPATADGQPVIDRVPGLDNAWVSAGHDGDGLLMAPATGQALAQPTTATRLTATTVGCLDADKGGCRIGTTRQIPGQGIGTTPRQDLGGGAAIAHARGRPALSWSADPGSGDMMLDGVIPHARAAARSFRAGQEPVGRQEHCGS